MFEGTPYNPQLTRRSFVVLVLVVLFGNHLAVGTEQPTTGISHIGEELQQRTEDSREARSTIPRRLLRRDGVISHGFSMTEEARAPKGAPSNRAPSKPVARSGVGPKTAPTLTSSGKAPPTGSSHQNKVHQLPVTKSTAPLVGGAKTYKKYGAAGSICEPDDSVVLDGCDGVNKRCGLSDCQKSCSQHADCQFLSYVTEGVLHGECKFTKECGVVSKIQNSVGVYQIYQQLTLPCPSSSMMALPSGLCIDRAQKLAHCDMDADAFSSVMDECGERNAQLCTADEYRELYRSVEFESFASPFNPKYSEAYTSTTASCPPDKHKVIHGKAGVAGGCADNKACPPSKYFRCCARSAEVLESSVAADEARKHHVPGMGGQEQSGKGVQSGNAGLQPAPVMPHKPIACESWCAHVSQEKRCSGTIAACKDCCPHSKDERQAIASQTMWLADFTVARAETFASDSKSVKTVAIGCPRGTLLTGCSCFSTSGGACAGALTDGTQCKVTQRGSHNAVVQAQARCGRITVDESKDVTSSQSTLFGVAEATAECPSDMILTGCSCTATDGACSAGAKSSGNMCMAFSADSSAVRAHARCAKIPRSFSWIAVLSKESSGRRGAQTVAECPANTVLTGCTCFSPSGSCDGAAPYVNKCTAYNKPAGSGVFAQARCGAIEEPISDSIAASSKDVLPAVMPLVGVPYEQRKLPLHRPASPEGSSSAKSDADRLVVLQRAWLAMGCSNLPDANWVGWTAYAASEDSRILRDMYSQCSNRHEKYFAECQPKDLCKELINLQEMDNCPKFQYNVGPSRFDRDRPLQEGCGSCSECHQKCQRAPDCQSDGSSCQAVVDKEAETCSCTVTTLIPVAGADLVGQVPCGAVELVDCSDPAFPHPHPEGKALCYKQVASAAASSAECQEWCVADAAAPIDCGGCCTSPQDKLCKAESSVFKYSKELGKSNIQSSSRCILGQNRPCLGTYAECVKAAQQECDKNEACEAVQVPVEDSPSWDTGYYMLRCVVRAKDGGWNHFEKSVRTETEVNTVCPFDQAVSEGGCVQDPWLMQTDAFIQYGEDYVGLKSLGACGRLCKTKTACSAFSYIGEPYHLCRLGLVAEPEMCRKQMGCSSANMELWRTMEKTAKQRKAPPDMSVPAGTPSPADIRSADGSQTSPAAIRLAGRRNAARTGTHDFEDGSSQDLLFYENTKCAGAIRSLDDKVLHGLTAESCHLRCWSIASCRASQTDEPQKCLLLEGKPEKGNRRGGMTCMIKVGMPKRNPSAVGSEAKANEADGPRSATDSDDDQSETDEQTLDEEIQKRAIPVSGRRKVNGADDQTLDGQIQQRAIPDRKVGPRVKKQAARVGGWEMPADESGENESNSSNETAALKNETLTALDVQDSYFSGIVLFGVVLYCSAFAIGIWAVRVVQKRKEEKQVAKPKLLQAHDMALKRGLHHQTKKDVFAQVAQDAKLKGAVETDQSAPANEIYQSAPAKDTDQSAPETQVVEDVESADQVAAAKEVEEKSDEKAEHAADGTTTGGA